MIPVLVARAKSIKNVVENNMKDKIIIVDERDNEIDCKDRKTLPEECIYRVSALWIKNNKGEILLAKRALSKSHSPGKWGPAVAGTVDEGENYRVNILKEAKEEIGLENVDPRIGPKERVSGRYNYFVQWYLLTIDKPLSEFAINHKEVDEVKWFSKDELLGELEDNPDNFLRTMERWVELFC